MNPDAIFSICSTIALVGWIALLIFPWFLTDRIVIGIIITLMGIVYAWLLFSHFKFGDASKFGSLTGVMELFKDPYMVTAGWIHYLAFDLLTGLFIKFNADKHGISSWIILPCLLLTFMFGPVGLLLYLLIRFVITKQYFANNF